jgi:hypothetical protein
LLIFATFKIHYAAEDVAQKAAIFLPQTLVKTVIQHRVGKWKHPQGIRIMEPEQRVVLYILYVQTIMDKFYEAWEIIYDYEKELREQGRENEASVLCQAGPIILKRSTEEVHKNLLKMQEQPRLQLRTIEREQPRQMPRPTIKPRSKEVQNGTIGGVVRTEWGTFFNIAQDPS